MNVRVILNRQELEYLIDLAVQSIVEGNMSEEAYNIYENLSDAHVRLLRKEVRA